jgi:hypothetical protein
MAMTTDKHAAVIVETREVQGFGQIVRNHLKHLPAHWHLEVYCADANQPFIEKELQGLAYNLHSGLVIKTVADYNHLFLSRGFWEGLLAYTRVLIFQADSEILRQGIEAFLHYDYVGAPWKLNFRGGNGGLSIRNPSAMIEALDKHSKFWYTPDMIWLMARMKWYRIMNRGKHKHPSQ